MGKITGLYIEITSYITHSIYRNNELHNAFYFYSRMYEYQLHDTGVIWKNWYHWERIVLLSLQICFYIAMNLNLYLTPIRTF